MRKLQYCDEELFGSLFYFTNKNKIKNFRFEIKTGLYAATKVLKIKEIIESFQTKNKIANVVSHFTFLS